VWQHCDVRVIERERVHRDWPWSAEEIERAVRTAYEHDWTRTEIIAFIDAFQRSSGAALTPSQATVRVLGYESEPSASRVFERPVLAIACRSDCSAPMLPRPAGLLAT
jgi:hypothetical protein